MLEKQAVKYYGNNSTNELLLGYLTDENGREMNIDMSQGIWFNSKKISNDHNIIDFLEFEAVTENYAQVTWSINDNVMLRSSYSFERDAETGDLSGTVGEVLAWNPIEDRPLERRETEGILDGETIDLRDYLREYLLSIDPWFLAEKIGVSPIY